MGKSTKTKSNVLIKLVPYEDVRWGTRHKLLTAAGVMIDEIAYEGTDAEIEADAGSLHDAIINMLFREAIKPGWVYFGDFTADYGQRTEGSWDVDYHAEEIRAATQEDLDRMGIRERLEDDQ